MNTEQRRNERQDQRHFDHVKDVYAALSAEGVMATEAVTFDGQESIVSALEIDLERRGLCIAEVPDGFRRAV